ncbi:MAG TPA: flagellar hook-length control protein FliK [Acetivibrio sp.]|uniref:flagellar hook-length control protein FliK n=1 Tax=Acetivibrio sp. TaxID=1872092 RepID=UPI002CADD4F2|nr:flagellar hook-length control protein FliK [Acetivibrio sp.]HOM02059.1 flagellar hook-length control protein FliK [Acetivibrio sp.]
MITQSIIPDFIAKMSGSKEVQKSSDIKKSSSSQFKNTFDLAVEKSNVKKGISSDEYRRDVRGRDYQRLQNKNSQDALEARENRLERSKPFERESNKKASGLSDKTERVTDEYIESENDKKLKGKAVGKALSEVLGISVEELEKLMAQLGISFEDFGSEESCQTAADKISAYLGLSSDEELALSNLMTLVQKEAQQALAKLDAANYSIGDENGAKDAELYNSQALMVSEDASASKSEIDISEVKNKLDEESDGLLNQIAAKVVEVLEEDENELGIKTPDISEVSLEEVFTETEVEDSSIKEIKASSDEKSNAGMNEGTNEEAASIASKNVEPETVTKNSESGQFGAISNSSIEKAAGQAEVERAQRNIPVTKKEIVEQVVEKAKVVLSGDKSEMVIDLKPEHLGKLELKIVTERGMVVAKFVAENEQVKAALESNMDMLKESLEKQGFSVEGFSVTVGDNKEKRDSRDKTNRGAANQRISNEKLQVSDMAGVERMQKIHESINPYSYGGSSINLTA